MKSQIKSPRTLDINSNTMMKPPHASSVPSLMDIDPFTEFEFHFPCQDMEWDFSDLSSSEPEDDDNLGASSLDISFSSSLYQILPDPDFTDDEDEEHVEKDEEDDVKNEDDMKDDSKEEDEICRRSPRDGDVDNEEGDEKNEEDDNDEEKNTLVSILLSTISEIAPKSVYKRRKNSMKRRRNRRKRKIVNNMELEFHSIYQNVGDLFVQSISASKFPPPSSLPTINLSNVNRTMLRRLPEVVNVGILSCSENPEFYTKIIGNAVTRTTSIPFTGFDRPGGKCFGTLPAILTDLGPVPPPEDSHYGYVYADGEWRVKAERPPVPDPGGGQRRGEGGRGRRVGAEHRGWREKIYVRDIK